MNFQSFLKDVFLGDAETIGFIKRLVGYIASGEKEEQIIPILYGTGRNGKTTFVEALKGAMGRDFQAGGSHVFGTIINPDKMNPMRVKGTKLLVFEGARLFSANLKALASNDAFVVEDRVLDERFSFPNTATPVLVANEIPGMFFREHALGERAVIIPFRARFENPQRDVSFNSAVVRAWIAEGMTDWMNFGLKIPAAYRIAAFGKRAA